MYVYGQLSEIKDLLLLFLYGELNIITQHKENISKNSMIKVSMNKITKKLGILQDF